MRSTAAQSSTPAPLVPGFIGTHLWARDQRMLVPCKHSPFPFSVLITSSPISFPQARLVATSGGSCYPPSGSSRRELSINYWQSLYSHERRDLCLGRWAATKISCQKIWNIWFRDCNTSTADQQHTWCSFVNQGWFFFPFNLTISFVFLRLLLLLYPNYDFLSLLFFIFTVSHLTGM